MKTAVLTLALSLVTAAPAFAGSIAGTPAKNLFFAVTKAGAPMAATSSRAIDLQTDIHTVTINGVYCSVVRFAAEAPVTSCAFEGKSVAYAADVVAAFDDVGVRFGKPSQDGGSITSDFSVQSLKCTRTTNSPSDFDHKLSQVSFECTIAQ